MHPSLEKFSKLAETNGAKLISTEWVSKADKLIFSIGETIFHITPATLSSKGWPSNPGGYYSLKEMRDIAEANGGSLESKEWVDSKTPLDFIHQDGNRFKISSTSIKKLGWPKDLQKFLMRSSVNNKDDLQYDKLKVLVETGGGKLLTPTWLGLNEKHSFEFPDGRTFETTPHLLRTNGWPKDPDLYFMLSKSDAGAELQMQRLRKEAADNNGVLLSDVWVDQNTLMDFRFEDGRPFKMSALLMNRNGWPKDPDEFFMRSKVNGMEDNQYDRLKREAASAGLELISDEWLGSGVPHAFRTADGRKIDISPDNIRFRGFPKDIDTYLRNFHKDRDAIFLRDLNDYAKNNNGKMISTKWTGSKDKYEFEDADGARFKITYEGAVRYGWPKDVEQFNRSYSEDRGDTHLAELSEIAISRGGKLLSTTWFGYTEEHEFEDAAGNRFFKSAVAIKNGAFSPFDGPVSEHVCRQAMCHLFSTNSDNVSFGKTRRVVKIDGGRPLELDGYEVLSDGRKIAFEYQGDDGHRDDPDVVYRDAMKLAFCKENNIALIVIHPFDYRKGWESRYVMQHILTAIVDSVDRSLIDASTLNVSGFEVDLTRINHAVNMLDKLRFIAESGGGRLISDKWAGSDKNYKFEFIDGRQFFTSYKNVIQNGVPKDLDAFFRKSKNNENRGEIFLNEMRKIANDNNGILLSDEYVNSHAKYSFLDDVGKVFEISHNQLTKEDKGWPKRINFLDRLRDLAAASNVTLLSNRWNGYAERYKFSFPDGREFERTIAQIKSTGFPADADVYFSKISSNKFKLSNEWIENINANAKVIRF